MNIPNIQTIGLVVTILGIGVTVITFWARYYLQARNKRKEMYKDIIDALRDRMPKNNLDVEEFNVLIKKRYLFERKCHPHRLVWMIGEYL